MPIVDRTDVGSGDCVLVTGSIGPQFEPKLFAAKDAAMAYAKEIMKYGKAHKVWPEFSPCLENRWKSDMIRMKIIS
jgi:hypothetical protein